ncbi:hypothetical protein NP233_g563 [Leucocoprinus birnbaumii]|uniref:Spindle pole body component n=1 Tax=Leucocoprinus birnbaumii TaxID=56174 RepID=A0AAD5W462_9AGAR|nr:hypothetical protein NP233_g563 [Leucocoprinus birnbaumii]
MKTTRPAVCAEREKGEETVELEHQPVAAREAVEIQKAEYSFLGPPLVSRRDIPPPDPPPVLRIAQLPARLPNALDQVLHRLAKSRIHHFANTIVTQVTGIVEDDNPEGYQNHVDYVVKSLEATTLNKGAASVDMKYVEQQINGHAEKARITMKDAVSEGLLVIFKRLKDHIESREKDLDHEIQKTHIPDHLQFLINLSQPPTDTTVSRAENILHEIKNPRPAVPTLTWKDILAEEPFEGEHWEGILDDKPRDGQEWDSTPSLSPLSSDLEDADSISSLSYDERRRPRQSLDQQEGEHDEDEDMPPLERITPGSSAPPYTHSHRKEYENLREMQYWRGDWKGYSQPSRKFAIGDPSTLGPAFSDVLSRKQGGFTATQALLQNVRYIREEDMVREVLMALQGRRNIVLTWTSDSFTTTLETPCVSHLTLTSQEAILSSLAQVATTLEHLRRFRSSVFALAYNRGHSRPAHQSRSITQTTEAFADAVDAEIRAFDTWCADQEAAICSIYTFPQPTKAATSDVIASLLHLTKSLSDTFEHTFPVLLQMTREVFSTSLSSSSELITSYIAAGARAPVMVTSRLLDALFLNVQIHLEREEVATSGRLMRVFVKTAEPVWGMCGKWLKDGMGLGLLGGASNVNGRGPRLEELDNEFFIEEKIFGFGGEILVGLLHPQFWQEAYGLREGIDSEDDGSSREHKAIPMFLEHVADMILSTGKAVGLIRALGSSVDVFGQDGWQKFEEVVALESARGSSPKNPGSLFSVSVDTLSRLIYERLLPHCQAVGKMLTQILVDECKLWTHLVALEDLMLMRRGDAMSHFIDVVFNKVRSSISSTSLALTKDFQMDSKQSWSDFHFLNSAFADVVEANLNAGAREWIQPSLVRFSHRGGRDKERMIYRTVKAIDGLTVEYAVPFPLTYIFRPSVVTMYSEVFGFLLQIRRAKSVLERILVRKDHRQDFGEGLKVFYAMRSRLSWFINTLLNFLTTYVIHAQVIKFHEQLQEVQSIDDMIQLHDDHLNKIQGRCLLKRNTSALQRAILSILHMSLQFSEFFSSFTGDAARHDISRHSIISKRHRSKRQRRKRRNIIGFSQPSTEDELSSSDGDDGDDGREPEILRDPAMETETFSTINATGSPEEIAERLDKFSSELDGLVRFVRRGVESLAGGTSEAAPAFGVLAFALEDWDA